MMTHEEGIV